MPYYMYITNKGIMTLIQTIINSILEVDNFQNVACYCADWKEFVEELAEWGVDGCAKIDFDDPELHIPMLDQFIKSENGYIKEVA